MGEHNNDPDTQSSMSYVRLVHRFRFEYKPLPDITAHELALILPFALNASHGPTNPYLRSQWEALGTANRHLPEIKG